jgi:hypothetical protein
MPTTKAVTIPEDYIAKAHSSLICAGLGSASVGSTARQELQCNPNPYDKSLILTLPYLHSQIIDGKAIGVTENRIKEIGQAIANQARLGSLFLEADWGRAFLNANLSTQDQERLEIHKSDPKHLKMADENMVRVDVLIRPQGGIFVCDANYTPWPSIFSIGYVQELAGYYPKNSFNKYLQVLSKLTQRHEGIVGIVTGRHALGYWPSQVYLAGLVSKLTHVHFPQNPVAARPAGVSSPESQNYIHNSLKVTKYTFAKVSCSLTSPCFCSFHRVLRLRFHPLEPNQKRRHTCSRYL